jgi:predicted permease
VQSLDRLLRDIRYALRSLRNCPVLAAAVILIVALGIGANTAVFSLLQGAVLAPLPYRDADRLVTVLLYNRALKFVSYLSYPDFLDWQRSSRSFEQISAFQNQGYDLTSPGEPQHVNGKEVSSGFFGTLGVNLALGRDISPEEDHFGGPPAVVITDRLWRGLFSRNPAALGKSIILSGVDDTIVGVLPPDFHFGDQDADVYTPLAPGDRLYRNDRSVHQIACIARLRPSMRLGEAQAEMNTIQDRIDADHPATERGQETWLAPLKQSIIGDIAGTLLLLLGAVGLVLLIACSNVANLLLARSAARTREAAIRLALGAGRAQIVRQLITESVLLSITGGLLGLLVAQSVLKTVLVIMAGNLPRARNITLNAPVLFFAFALSLAVGIGFGLIPALRSSATDVHATLKAGSRGTTAGQRRSQSALVILQISLALILLTGGSLLLRTIHNLLVVNPGFDPRRVVTFQIGLSPSVATPAQSSLPTRSWPLASAGFPRSRPPTLQRSCP